MEIKNNLKLFREFIIATYGAENTASTYSAALGKFLKYYEHIAEPKAITADMIISYLATIVGGSSKCTAHSAIKLFYKWKSPHAESAKFKYIPYPEKPDTIPDHVTMDDFILLMQVCDYLKHKCIILLAFDCGLRVSEVVNLKINDVDTKLMNINIRQSKGKKDRILKLTTITLQYLREYREQYKPVTYVFNGQIKLQYAIRTCQEVVTALCKKAKIKHYKFHALRHGFAMMLYETGGYSLETIRDMMGHEDVKSTQIYARKNNNIIQRTLTPIELLMSKSKQQLQLA